MLDITFMRHARSLGDDLNVHEGRYDAPLTDVGRDQVRQRAAAFVAEQRRFDAIIASPLVRAYEAAQIMAQALNLEVEAAPEWMEFNNGPLAGLSYAEAEQRYPMPAFRNPYELFWETGESDWDLQVRAINAIQSLIRRGAGRYLIVSHGAILNAAMRHIMSLPPAPNWQHPVVFAFGDTGYARFEYAPDQHRWTLLEFNHGFLDE